MSIPGTMRIESTIKKLIKHLVCSATLMWTTTLLAQPQVGEVSHWEDGSPMGCTYVFAQEPLFEWDQTQPPPVDIQAATRIAREVGESKNLNNVLVTSLRLIGVRPHGHDFPMLVMFVKYAGFPPRTPIISGDDHHWLAITPLGTVVEPVCE